MSEETVALVTGASRGIGRATALALARAGIAVAVSYRSDPEGAEEVVAKIRAEGPGGMALPLDVRDESSVEAVFTSIEEALGPVSVLVNNAAMRIDGLTARYPIDTFDDTFATNVRGVFLCIRRALPAMMRRRWGRIVNVSSAAAAAGLAGQAAYAGSKAALHGMSRSLAQEVGRRGITVNVVCPGFVETHMTATATERARQVVLDRTALGRFGTPEEVAAIIAFLATSEASYITGVIASADGGMT